MHDFVQTSLCGGGCPDLGDLLIHPISGEEAIKRLGHQILMPKAPHEMISYLDMIDVLLKTTPCYLLSCNMEEEAAVVAYQGMNH